MLTDGYAGACDSIFSKNVTALDSPSPAESARLSAHYLKFQSVVPTHPHPTTPPPPLPLLLLFVHLITWLTDSSRASRPPFRLQPGRRLLAPRNVQLAAHVVLGKACPGKRVLRRRLRRVSHRRRVGFLKQGVTVVLTRSWLACAAPSTLAGCLWRSGRRSSEERERGLAVCLA